jgi:hypothetical protein
MYRHKHVLSFGGEWPVSAPHFSEFERTAVDIWMIFLTFCLEQHEQWQWCCSWGRRTVLYVGMRIALRRHKLPPENVALFLDCEAEWKAEQERFAEATKRWKEVTTKQMEDGVGKVVTEVVELRQFVDTRMHELGTQAEEIKGQNQQLRSELHSLKEGMAELQSWLKSNLAQPSESPEDYMSRKAD